MGTADAGLADGTNPPVDKAGVVMPTGEVIWGGSWVGGGRLDTGEGVVPGGVGLWDGGREGEPSFWPADAEKTKFIKTSYSFANYVLN